MSNTNNAAVTVKAARDLRGKLKAAGVQVTVAESWKLARIAQWAVARVAEDMRVAQRNERVRKGMVANAVADLRACGAWDGE